MLWIFDLDNTLHHTSKYIFPQITKNINQYIAQHILGSDDLEAANALRLQFWRDYGATLLGIAKEKNENSRKYLHDVHLFPDLKQIVLAEKNLRDIINKIPGRKIIVTNSAYEYAKQVVNILGLNGCFEKIYAIDTSCVFGRFTPKPSAKAFKKIAHLCRVKPAQCILVEDDIRALKVAKSLRMKTIWFVRYRQKDEQLHATPYHLRENVCENLSYIDYRVNSMHQLSKIAQKII